MKKFNNLLILIASVLLLTASTVYSAEQRRITRVTTAAGVSDIAVASTGTVYTKAFWIKSTQNDEDLGVMYRATSDGAVDINIDLEQSFDFPSTEGAADSAFLVTHNVNTELTDEIWRIATVDSVVMPVGRFRLTGEGSNHASTTIEIKLGKH